MSKHDTVKKHRHDDHEKHGTADPRHGDGQGDGPGDGHAEADGHAAGHDEAATPEVRVEVVANRSVQEDLFERLSKREVGARYTLFPEVHGAGLAGPRRGDHIWPEENFVYVTYVTKKEARAIREEVEALKTFFPDEGIRFFAVKALDL